MEELCLLLRVKLNIESIAFCDVYTLMLSAFTLKFGENSFDVIRADQSISELDLYW